MSSPANPPSSPSPPAAKRRKMSVSGSVAVPSPSAFTPTPSRPSSSQSTLTAFGFPDVNIFQPEAVPMSVPDADPPQHRSPGGQYCVSAIWPAQIVPVEIFNLIIQHLDRGDVQAMRLVNREFDSKLADRFFRHVVVPFRPEFEAMYGTLNTNLGVVIDQQKFGLVLKKKAENICITGDGHNGPEEAIPAPRDESLLSAGYRVFEQFGPNHIKKFALALELDEKHLAYPPVKLNQQIIPAPWGLYRWPILDYQRFSQLEGLEKMADETQHMKKAFQFLSTAVEIGISCDAGLGYLQGPDTNHLCRRPQPSVFQPTTYDAAEPENDLGPDEDRDRSLGLVVLKKMAMNAGYNSTEWPRAVLRLLEDEGRAVKWVERISSSGRVIHERVPLIKVTDDTTREDMIQSIEDFIVSTEDPEHNMEAAYPRVFGLTPNNLTSAQAEMLLELEWAHRALMESYVIAVMDNKNSFQSLRKLTIARCPGCHVPSLMKEKFWETMTCIEAFHLGVIPDWRQVNKDDTGVISQKRVSPVDSYGAVFQLLHKYVAGQKNITHVSFEWISGGEFAVGKSQRDRYILPAPILADASNMVRVTYAFGEDDVLNLPFIRRLSLKNCWISPHVFLNVFKYMSKGMLEGIELESVSLTGPPSWVTTPAVHLGIHGKPPHWPWPLCAGAEPGNWFQLQRPVGANNNNNNNGAANPAGGQPPAAAPQGGINQPANPWHGVANWNLHQQFAFGHHGPGAIPLNHPEAPVQQNGQNTAENRWRLFSWPYVLADLGMSPQAVQAHLDDTSTDDKYYKKLKLAEKQFSVKFRSLLRDRNGRGRLQEIRFKSCGYALVDSPNIDNWKIIPAEPLLVLHNYDFIARLKELDSQMLTSGDNLLGKVLNYIPDSEQRLLRTVFGLEFGWTGLYDEIVKQVALVDGNPAPGHCRFRGVVSSLTDEEREKLKSKGGE